MHGATMLAQVTYAVIVGWNLMAEGMSALRAEILGAWCREIKGGFVRAHASILALNSSRWKRHAFRLGLWAGNKAQRRRKLWACDMV